MTATGKGEVIQHSLQMDERKRAQITGVSDVCSFHETEIVLRVDTGVMVVSGENLHIGKLLLDDGRLDVEGQIDSIVYEKPRPAVHRFLRWKQGTR